MRLSLGPALSSVRKGFKDTFTRLSSNGLGVADDGTIWNDIRSGQSITGNVVNSSSASSYPMSVTGMPYTDVTLELTGTSIGSMAALWVADSENWWGVAVNSAGYSITNIAGYTNYSYVSSYGTNYGYASGGGNSNSYTNSPSYYAGNYVASYYNGDSTTPGYMNSGVYVQGTTNAAYNNGNYVDAVPASYVPGNSYSYFSYVNYNVMYATNASYYRAYQASYYNGNYVASYNNGGYSPGTMNAAVVNAYGYNNQPYSNSSYTPAYVNAGYVNSYYAYNYVTGYNTFYTSGTNTEYATSYGFNRGVNLIQSVNGVKQVVQSWSLSAAAVVQSLRVKLLGSQITIQPYSDTNLVTQIGNDLVYTPTGVTITPRFGIGLAQTDEQGSSGATGFTAYQTS